MFNHSNFSFTIILYFAHVISHFQTEIKNVQFKSYTLKRVKFPFEAMYERLYKLGTQHLKDETWVKHNVAWTIADLIQSPGK
jgi:hypothetical protein